jgi:glycosyltransferase involved in cell wall biosynthesis
MNLVDVTVCTPTIPHRSEMLQECMESVRNQTWTPKAHLVAVDFERVGGARMLNQLIDAAKTEWIAPLADDDLFYPQYIEKLLSNAGDADMIYPWCEVTGTRNGWNPNSLLDIERLKKDNYIPATVLIRKSAWEKLGGYPEVVCEDHAMWVKMIDANIKSCCCNSSIKSI